MQEKGSKTAKKISKKDAKEKKGGVLSGTHRYSDDAGNVHQVSSTGVDRIVWRPS
jgi:hypothetical protein